MTTTIPKMAVDPANIALQRKHITMRLSKRKPAFKGTHCRSTAAETHHAAVNKQKPASKGAHSTSTLNMDLCRCRSCKKYGSPDNRSTQGWKGSAALIDARRSSFGGYSSVHKVIPMKLQGRGLIKASLAYESDRLGCLYYQVTVQRNAQCASLPGHPRLGANKAYYDAERPAKKASEALLI